jgi:galactoside O-acetyltransferase
MWLSNFALIEMGFKEIGSDCLVEESAIILGAPNISLGNRVRIDAFTIISTTFGEVFIGNDVHISASVSIHGSGGLTIGDGAAISGGSRIFTETDDFTGGYLSNPTIATKFRNVKSAKISISKHVLVGANSVVLPGVHIGEHASIGALTLVTESVAAYTVVSGVPARKIKDRDVQGLQEITKLYESNN